MRKQHSDGKYPASPQRYNVLGGHGALPRIKEQLPVQTSHSAARGKTAQQRIHRSPTQKEYEGWPLADEAQQRKMRNTKKGRKFLSKAWVIS